MHDYTLIPPNTIQTIKDYVERGLKPGSFIDAVLTNDLRTACARADIENRHVLYDIVMYCENEIPGACWGSTSKVIAWRSMPRSRR